MVQGHGSAVWIEVCVFVRIGLGYISWSLAPVASKDGDGGYHGIVVVANYYDRA